jgi:serine/threonine protein kinase
VEDGFLSALAHPSGERASFLKRYCAGDRALQDEIEDLLRNHEEADGLLDTPVLELGSVREAFRNSSIGAGTRISPYTIVSRLGRGGMAAVYRARRTGDSFEQEVAIKILDPLYSDAGGQARFRQEQQILGKLAAPHICQILDSGSVDGFTYFVMEYIDGPPIDEYCRKHNLSTEERLRLFLKICEGVSIAHNGQVVHRDLKPANILVDRSGSPRLIDFGIAKVLNASPAQPLTAPGFELMTLHYASPEQLDGDTDLAN